MGSDALYLCPEIGVLFGDVNFKFLSAPNVLQGHVAPQI